jgi:hypothetical protein
MLTGELRGAMTVPNPIPAGSKIDADRQSNTPSSVPKLPASWTATVLLSPFGDSISPLSNPAQLVVGVIESSVTSSESWLRAGLYLTQNQRYYEFVYMSGIGNQQQSVWYWIDSDPQGPVKNIYGPFRTTLTIPGSAFLEAAGAQWGNAYPLMCTDKNVKGIDCDHWVLPSPGSTDHGTWCAFRKSTGCLFRIFMMDSTNPLMIPILGSFYIANVPTFTAKVSDMAESVVEKIKSGAAKACTGYWNPLVTQEDIHRAMAFPIAEAGCTPHDLEAVIPGFTATRSDAGLPRWSDQTYIEGWTLGTDFIPYFTRVCYLWTGRADSKQQTVFIGLGTVPGQSTYLQRTDTCLNMTGTLQPYYEWQTQTNGWTFTRCLEPNPPVGLPRPDWLARDKGKIMAQIRGNPNFGLATDQTIRLIAAELPRGGGELAIFWLWFLEDGTGMLFSEGNYMNPLSHNLQLIDYNVFVQNAGLTQGDFSNPCAPAVAAQQAELKIGEVHGHLTQLGARPSSAA